MPVRRRCWVARIPGRWRCWDARIWADGGAGTRGVSAAMRGDGAAVGIGGRVWSLRGGDAGGWGQQWRRDKRRDGDGSRRGGGAKGEETGGGGGAYGEDASRPVEGGGRGGLGRSTTHLCALFRTPQPITFSTDATMLTRTKTLFPIGGDGSSEKLSLAHQLLVTIERRVIRRGVHIWVRHRGGVPVTTVKRCAIVHVPPVTRVAPRLLM